MRRLEASDPFSTNAAMKEKVGSAAESTARNSGHSVLARAVNAHSKVLSSKHYSSSLLHLDAQAKQTIATNRETKINK